MGPNYVVRCAKCDTYSDNAPPDEFYGSPIIPEPAPIRSLPKPTQPPAPKVRPEVPSWSRRPTPPKEPPRKEPTLANPMLALAYQVKVYELAEALTKRTEEDPASRDKRPASFQQKQAWIRERIIFLHNNDYYREEDREFGLSLARRFYKRDELSLAEWECAERLLLGYQNDVGSLPDELK